MNFNIITLGCKVNQYESQAMREDLLKNGFELAKPNTPADITVKQLHRNFGKRR